MGVPLLQVPGFLLTLGSTSYSKYVVYLRTFSLGSRTFHSPVNFSTPLLALEEAPIDPKSDFISV